MSLVAVCLVHAAFSANTRYAILQYHDADTKEMLQDLERVGSVRSGASHALTLLASWELAPSIEYYRVTRPLPWLQAVSDTPGPADAAFLSGKDVSLIGSLVTLKRYPVTKNILAVAPDLVPTQRGGIK